MTLKFKMICAVSVLVTVMLLMVTLFTLNHFERRIKSMIAAQQLSTVTVVAQEIDTTLLSLQELLFASAKVFPLKDLDSKEASRAFLKSRTGLHKHFNLNLFVLSASGELIAESFPIEQRRRHSFATSPIFLKTVATLKPQISDLDSCCQEGNSAHIMISSPVVDSSGRLRAVMVGAIDLRKHNVLSRFSEFKVGDRGFIRLVTGNGIIIMHREMSRILVKTTPDNQRLVKAALNGFSGTDETIGRDGLQLLTSVRKLKCKDWVVMASIPKKEVMEPITTARIYYAWAALAAILIAILIVAFFMNSLTRPISLFTRHLQELPNKIGMDRQIHLHTGDEIEVMAHTFNTMVMELDDLTAQLERRVEERTAQLQNEILQRTAAQEEITWLNNDLLRQKQALEAAYQELESFSYSVSHDLRAPIHHISAFSNILLQDYTAGCAPEAKEMLLRVQKSCTRMNALIDDLLVLSKVSRSDLHLQPVDISTLCQEVVSELRESSPGREVSVEIATGLNAFCDLHLMRIVLQNIIGNAWKYTGKSDTPRIEIGQVTSDDRAEFFVRDNGAGFDMACAGQIFKPFQRLHAANEFEGTGVGLATVHRIITRHGGNIRAESFPGKGSTFWFSLG